MLRQLEPDRSEADFQNIKKELKKNMPPGDAGAVPGLVHSAMVGRIANRLDLKGPAFTVDAACAAVLVATQIGISQLRSGTCDSVLVGGAQVSTPGPIHVIFSQLEALSRSGKIAPFSEESAGTLLGQGCGMLLLKRRCDAERDGNRIYALVKSVGVSSDGRGAGLLAPLSAGQQLAIRRAYDGTSIKPSSVGLVEAHATGIPLGDRTELQSLSAVFKEDREAVRNSVAIGSVKSMIGHLIPASGAASMIKTALALFHRTLPPTLHAETPHPELAINDSPFYLANEAKPWLHSIHSTPRRAAINGFGFGGINAHAILEEHVQGDECLKAGSQRKWPCELVIISAGDQPGLISAMKSLADWVEHAPHIHLADIAAASARQISKCRIAIVASNCDELICKLRRSAELLADPKRTQVQDRSGIFWYALPQGNKGGVAFLFPGEGAQYVNMMDELCLHFPVFRKQFDLAATALKVCGYKSPLNQVLYPQANRKEQAQEELLELETAVASLTAAGRGFMELLRKLGIEPDAIVGHSSGEFGALLAAGVFRPANQAEMIQAIVAGAKNARLLEESNLVPRATLLSVGGADSAAVNQVVDRFDGRLVIAMDNCPHQKIVVGAKEDIDKAIELLRGKGGLCQTLPWDRAYHTEAFLPASAVIREFYARLDLHSPQVDLWSCCTAKKYPNKPNEVAKLAIEQWHSPVRFRETVKAMYADGIRIFVELGPRGNLASFVSDTLQGKDHLAIPLALPNKSPIEQLCRAIGMLVAHDARVDLDWFFQGRATRAIDLSSPPPPAERLDPLLPMELPVFELDRKICEEWQSASAYRSSGTPGLERPQVSINGTEGLGTEGASYLEADCKSEDRVPAQSFDESDADFNDHHADFQETMTMFLKTQQQILKRLPESAGHYRDCANAGPAVIADNERTSIEHHADSVTVFQAEAIPYRFLEKKVHHEPNSILIAECELDPEKHIFLKDHTFFGRGISRFDPQLKALSVMPLAMTLELMAEAVAELCPDELITAISNIVTTNWLAFDTPTRLVQIRAERINDTRIHGHVFALDRSEDAAMIASAIFQLGGHWPNLGPPAIKEVQGTNPNWSDDLIYPNMLYHREAFQGVKTVERLGGAGIQARVMNPDPGLMFRDQNARPLVIPVGLIDTASQLPGLANVSAAPDECDVSLAFPNTTAMLEFASPDKLQHEMTAVVSFEQDDSCLTSDVEFISSDGEVLLRYSGRVEERVCFPGTLYHYQAEPATTHCGRDIAGLFADVPGIEFCRVVEPLNIDGKVLVRDLWSEVVARMVLSAREREAWSRIKQPPVRGAGWLLGRIAAKDAVRMLSGKNRCLADIEISNDTHGKPFVHGFGETGMQITIAHKVFQAVAAATTHHRGIGIDIEPNEEIDQGVVADSFNVDELAIVASVCGCFAPAWTAKEAVAKALGTGLKSGPADAVIVAANLVTGGWVFDVALAGGLANTFPEFAINTGRVLTAHSRLHNQHVITLCLINQP